MTLSGSQPCRIGVLIHDNVTMIDVAGPADVFHHANAYGGNYQTVLIGLGGADATASNGLRLHADIAVEEAGELDTIIVPGAYGMVGQPLPAALVAAVERLAARTRRVTSVCTGSFLLAQAGLLDGRAATTHWTRVDLFRQSFPKVDVRDDVLFVRDGMVTTSAGIGSGVDLALTFVEDDLGPAAARDVARQMLVFMQRPGGQSQFSVPTRAAVAVERPLRAVLDGIAADPAADHSLAAMARVANVSQRQLAREFHDVLQTTPARYVEAVRLEAAQALLEKGRSVAATAELSGLGSPESLRRVFLSRLGVSPSIYAEQVRPSVGPPVGHG